MGWRHHCPLPQLHPPKFGENLHTFKGCSRMERGCHTPIFDLKSYCHMSLDPEYSLTFQRKIRQRVILKCLFFFVLGPAFFTLLLVFFIYFIFYFLLLFIFYYFLFLFYFIFFFYFIFIFISFCFLGYFLFYLLLRIGPKIKCPRSKIFQFKCQLSHSSFKFHH